MSSGTQWGFFNTWIFDINGGLWMRVIRYFTCKWDQFNAGLLLYRGFVDDKKNTECHQMYHIRIEGVRCLCYFV